MKTLGRWVLVTKGYAPIRKNMLDSYSTREAARANKLDDERIYDTANKIFVR